MGEAKKEQYMTIHALQRIQQLECRLKEMVDAARVILVGWTPRAKENTVGIAELGVAVSRERDWQEIWAKEDAELKAKGINILGLEQE